VVCDARPGTSSARVAGCNGADRGDGQRIALVVGRVMGRRRGSGAFSFDATRCGCYPIGKPREVKMVVGVTICWLTRVMTESARHAATPQATLRLRTDRP